MMPLDMEKKYFTENTVLNTKGNFDLKKTKEGFSLTALFLSTQHREVTRQSVIILSGSPKGPLTLFSLIFSCTKQDLFSSFHHLISFSAALIHKTSQLLKAWFISVPRDLLSKVAQNRTFSNCTVNFLLNKNYQKHLSMSTQIVNMPKSILGLTMKMAKQSK